MVLGFLLKKKKSLGIQKPELKHEGDKELPEIIDMPHRTIKPSGPKLSEASSSSRSQLVKL